MAINSWSGDWTSACTSIWREGYAKKYPNLDLGITLKVPPKITFNTKRKW